MKLTNEQIEVLKKYNINYKVKTKRDLLINIDFVMTDYLDSEEEPIDDFKVLEKLYDKIYFEIPEEAK